MSCLLCVAVGAFFLGIAYAQQRALKAAPPPLQLVRPANTGTDAPPVTIPPPNLDYRPVYLTDPQIAALERSASGNTGQASHDPVEASRR